MAPFIRGKDVTECREVEINGWAWILDRVIKNRDSDTQCCVCSLLFFYENLQLLLASQALDLENLWIIPRLEMLHSPLPGYLKYAPARNFFNGHRCHVFTIYFTDLMYRKASEVCNELRMALLWYKRNLDFQVILEGKTAGIIMARANGIIASRGILIRAEHGEIFGVAIHFYLDSSTLSLYEWDNNWLYKTYIPIPTRPSRDEKSLLLPAIFFIKILNRQAGQKVKYSHISFRLIPDPIARFDCCRGVNTKGR